MYILFYEQTIWKGYKNCKMSYLRSLVDKVMCLYISMLRWNKVNYRGWRQSLSSVQRTVIKKRHVFSAKRMGKKWSWFELWGWQVMPKRHAPHQLAPYSIKRLKNTDINIYMLRRDFVHISWYLLVEGDHTTNEQHSSRNLERHTTNKIL